MKEKIEKTNFNELTLDGANEILNELLSYDGDDFRNLVINIIDVIDYSSVNENNMNPNVEVIFNNERVKNVIYELSDEYETEK